MLKLVYRSYPSASEVTYHLLHLCLTHNRYLIHSRSLGFISSMNYFFQPKSVLKVLFISSLEREKAIL